MEFIRSAMDSALFSAHSGDLQELGTLFEAKLWHQLAEKLVALVAQPEFAEHQRLLQLYENFVQKVAQQLNPFTVAQIAIKAGQQCQDGNANVQFLLKVAEDLKSEEEASLLLQLQLASLKLQAGDAKACSLALEQARKTIDESPREMHTLISSRFYQVKLEYHKLMGTASEFFRNALLYLSYTPLDGLSAAEQVALASDLGLAALVGEDIYNFGELLEHEIVKTLCDSSFGWLSQLLDSFNEGDIDRFEVIYREHVATQEILRMNEAFLRQKIRIMNLMEMVFRRASDDRTLTFADISSECKVSIDEVELLLMKAMSLETIKGSIDEVEQTVQVKWVQPRVLNAQQIESMRDRLGQWTSKLEESVVYLENNAPELLG